MKVLILPPLTLDEMNGARTRTVEIYSRVKGEIQVTLAVSPTHDPEPNAHFIERMKQLSTVRGYIGKNPVKLLFSLVRIIRFARGVDAVLCYLEYGPAVVYSYIVASLSGKPLLIIIHHVEDGLRHRGLLMNRALQACSGLLCLDNEIVLKEVKEMFPRKHIFPVTNGVDTSYYLPAASHSRKICLYVGVLSERKGRRLLLEIWEQVVRAQPKAELRILAGITPTEEIESFLSIAAELGIRNSITVTGYINEQRKLQEYQEAEVLIFPSTYEGFGLAVAEALSSGLPAVLWDLPSFTRFTDGVLKVPFPDVKSYGALVVRLLNEPDLRNELSGKGVIFACNNLTWDLAAFKEKSAIRSLFQGFR